MGGNGWENMADNGINWEYFWLWDETVATMGIPMDSINRHRDNSLMGFIGGFTS
jgi:hypothetical protein